MSLSNRVLLRAIFLVVAKVIVPGIGHDRLITVGAGIVQIAVVVMKNEAASLSLFEKL